MFMTFWTYIILSVYFLSLLGRTLEIFKSAKACQHFNQARMIKLPVSILLLSFLLIFSFSPSQTLFLFNSVSNISGVKSLPQTNCNTFVLFFDTFQSHEFEMTFLAVAVEGMLLMLWVRDSPNDVASELICNNRSTVEEHNNPINSSLFKDHSDPLMHEKRMRKKSTCLLCKYFIGL